MPALLSRFMLSQAPICLTSSALRTFKQALSDEFLGRQLTSLSLVELFYLFPTFGPLSEKNNDKQLFDTRLINSRSLAENHVVESLT